MLMSSSSVLVSATTTGWRTTAMADFRGNSMRRWPGGWLGIAMPEEYGGAGLGIAEAAIMMQAVAESGAGMSGASAIHMNIFGLNPVVVFGTEEQKQRMLPPLIAGEDKACFAVTEPDAGLDTTQLNTRAERRRRSLRRHRAEGLDLDGAGRRTRCCCSRARRRSRQVPKPTDGLSLFYTDARSLARRGARDRQDGPQGGRFEHSSSSTASTCRPSDRIGEEGQRLRVHPARAQSRAHPDCRGGSRHRLCRARTRRAATRRNASCSAGRSARTRASSIRWRKAGWSSRPRNLMVFKAACAVRRRQAVRRGGQCGQISRGEAGLQGLRDAR